MSVEQHMPEARMIAAQCWCDKETKNTEMDVVLAEAVARRIAIWMDTAMMHIRNEEFYRGLLDQCANNLGPLKDQAYMHDRFTDEPLRLKIPGLVAELAAMVPALPPVPVESPDDWVTQDRVPPRDGFDQIRWSDWPQDRWISPCGKWEGSAIHGFHDKKDGTVLSVRCRRKDLPPPVFDPQTFTSDYGPHPSDKLPRYQSDATCSIAASERERKEQAVAAALVDWPEDASHENGNYESVCLICKCRFIGHKRRVFCRQCQNRKAQPAVKRIPVRLWVHHDFENDERYNVFVKLSPPKESNLYREILNDDDGFYVNEE